MVVCIRGISLYKKQIDKQNTYVAYFEGGMKMSLQKSNPDNRSDNVEKLQDMVQNTIENIDKAEETLVNASSGDKEMIQQKNKRREAAIQSFKEEIQDEASDRENGYQ